jgi:hypothetical protein
MERATRLGPFRVESTIGLDSPNLGDIRPRKVLPAAGGRRGLTACFFETLTETLTVGFPRKQRT